MAIVTRNNVLNLQPGLSAPVVVHVSQGDQGYPLKFYLVNGDEIYPVPYNVTITMTGTRIDGSHFGPYSCSFVGNEVTTTIRAAITRLAGSAIAELTLTNNSGEVVGSANFGFMIEECTIPEGVTYSNDSSIYQDILKYVQTATATDAGLINALDERISNLVVEAGGSDITEVVDARMSFGGVAQTVLKDRIDLFLEYDVVEATSEVLNG